MQTRIVDSDRNEIRFPQARANPEDDSNALTARSEKNVREWMSYLPQDCIESMIRMGWDLST